MAEGGRPSVYISVASQLFANKHSVPFLMESLIVEAAVVATAQGWDKHVPAIATAGAVIVDEVIALT
jgi:hypothetical protein